MTVQDDRTTNMSGEAAACCCGSASIDKLRLIVSVYDGYWKL